jgi:photosystem II stability/assembly factor-like uncharacterized protein
MVTIRDAFQAFKAHAQSRRVIPLCVPLALSALVVLAAPCPSAEALTPAGDGWFWQNPLPQGNRLEDVTMIDTKLGWAVGRGDTALQTTNGGLTWEARDVGANETLAGVSFVSADVGWITSWGPFVFATVDGGQQWRELHLPVPAGASPWPEAIDFVDDRHGWVAGSIDAFGPGVIYSTIDAGLTWSVSTDDSWPQLTAVDFADRLHGCAVGTYGAVLRTVDGGRTWNSRTLDSDVLLESVRFADARHGWVAGSGGTLFRTTDGGRNWHRVHVPLMPYLTGLSFSDKNHGWAVGYEATGELYRGVVLRTFDGGKTWTVQTRALPDSLHAVSSAGPTRAVAVGDAGLVARTIDGLTWARSSTGLISDISDVAVADADNAWAVGGDIYGKRGFVLRTSDGGGSWRQLPIEGARSSATPGLVSICCFGHDNVWAVGAQGVVYRSRDGGESWLRRQVVPAKDCTLTDVCFVDASMGWATGYREPEDQAIILRTTDGGQTWSSYAPPGAELLSKIDFTDRLHGWTAGSGGEFGESVLLRTMDGGATWTRLSGEWRRRGGNIGPLDFIDAFQGWFVDWDTVWHTIDGGLTWQKAQLSESQTISDLAFTDADHGWAVGTGILETQDGGQTWRTLAVRLYFGADLTTVACVDRQHVWAGGGGGAILFTSSEPVTVDDADNWWHGRDVTVALRASAAAGAAIARTEYALDGAAGWTAGTSVSIVAPQDHSADGRHTVRYRSIDTAGRVETTRACGVVIDTRGPSTSVTRAVSARRGASATIRYRVVDALCPSATTTIRIVRAGGRSVVTRYLGLRPTNRTLVWRFRCNLAPGTYRIEVRAVDLAGNEQAMMTVRRLRVVQ